MNALSEWWTRVALLFWPPYGLRFGAPMDEGTPASFQPRARNWPAIPSEAQQAHLAAAESIYRAEQERKKTIEDKASSFFAGATMSSSLVLALPTLLIGKIDMSVGIQLVIAGFFAVAAAYLLGAAYHATRVRAGGQAFVVNATSLESLRVGDSDFRRIWALTLLDITRLNESFLTRKTNHLYVAEQMFLRGVLLAVLAGLILAMAAILRPVALSARSDSDVAFLNCMQSNLILSAELVNSAALNGELRAAVELALKQETIAKAKLHARLASQSSSTGNCCIPAQMQGICQTAPAQRKSDAPQDSLP